MLVDTNLQAAISETLLTRNLVGIFISFNNKIYR